jgi:chaperonin GroES
VLIFLRSPLESAKSQNQITRAMPLAGRAPCRVRSGAARGDLLKICLSLEENDMTFRPLHDRILVRRVEAEEKTAGGIIIPDPAKEKPMEGEVIAAGPGGRDESGKLVPLDLKTGDRILFGKWSGTEIRLDGEDLLIMKESDVLGVIEAAATLRKAA